MKFIICPFCGNRPLAEFHFRKTESAKNANATDSVYMRSHYLDRSVEHWQHSDGCRQWLRIERDPSTGRVESIQPLKASQT